MAENDSCSGEDDCEASKVPRLEGDCDSPARGYQVGAPLYRQAGWQGVLPLPPGQKFPPLKGYTGHDGAWPTEQQIEGWIRDEPLNANLMLRLNYGLIGIDVDAYGTKAGGRTLEEAEKRWGKLPPTYRSSARIDDSVSGIRVFKVPDASFFRGVIKFDDLGIGDIEIVQAHHRYMVAWPSINPKNSQRYRWFDTDGSLMPEGRIPRVADLPNLPLAWREALSRDALREAVFDGSSSDRTSARRQQLNEELYRRLIAMEDDGVPDTVVGERLDRAIAELKGGSGSRYDTTRDHVLALVSLRAKGHIGVPNALDRLLKLYVDEVIDTRPRVVAETEFLRFTEGAAVLVAASPPGGSEEAEEAFWTQREILSKIRAFARSRSVAPYAVLGGVLRRAIALVPPSVQLPPIVGDAASVNLFTVSVGRSGQGKDAANGVARAAVVFVNSQGEVIHDPPSAVAIGSGEGLAKALRPSDDEDSPATRINLEVPEIGTLGALAARTGATVIGELLKGYMGQQLGFTNAQRTTSSFVPAHSYRLCLGVGAQPENAEVFTSREKDGLPQRFLWLPTIDPFAPPPSDDQDCAIRASRVCVPTSFPTPIADTPYFVAIPVSARAMIKRHRHRVVIGDPSIDPLDSHLMLTRLKVGFGLALLDGRTGVSDEDWNIAGELIGVSNRARADLRKVIAKRRTNANAARAHDQADRQVIIDERLMAERSRRVSEAVERKLRRETRATRRQLSKAVTSTLRGDFDAVFDIMLENGTVVPCEGGRRYALGLD
jgi:hypothetical protein